MKRKRFTEIKIIEILRQHEAGVKMADLCREHDVSTATIYSWRTKYGGPEGNEAQRLKQMEDENRRLKQLVAELSLDREALKAVIKKVGRNSHT
jgi:putative transposase